MKLPSSLLLERKTGETQLFVKQVMIEGKRYIVCRNEAEAEKDRRTASDRRRARRPIEEGDKALIATPPIDVIYASAPGPRTRPKARTKTTGV